MNDESISGGSNVEYQVRIDFRNPCYPRNPWLNLFCDKRSYFRRGHRSEEYPQHLFSPNHAHQFVHRAIHNNQHEQDDLDSPEMWPHDFRQQLFVAGHKAASLPPEIDKTLQLVNERGHQQVDQGLPANVVDQWFMGKAID